MQKFLKKTIFAIIALSFLSTAGFASALEIIYPKIPFYPDINNCAGQDCMAKFISYWFGFGIMLAGVIALISLIVASVQLMTSAGNPGARGDATDRIKGALLGMVLLLSSFIIMRTINPVLVTPSLTPLGEVAGVFYTNGSESAPAPISEADTSNIPEGFETIIYKCAENAYSPTLLVWRFNNTNFDISSAANIQRVDCGQSSGLVGYGSFKMAFETPGIYYFLGESCGGYMSGPVLSSEAQIAEPFKGNIKSIRIVNDENNKFGFVIHKDIDFRGQCDTPYILTNTDNNNCIKIYMPSSSIDVFSWNGDVKSSGNGVTFYSEPFGKESRTPGAQSGFYNLGFEEIGRCMNNGFCGGSPDKIDFSPSYDFINVDPKYRTRCPNFGWCPGSIKIQGDYTVILYTGYQEDNTAVYCQVFDEDAPNLNAEEFMGEGRDLLWVDVVPTK